jgi:hypothetical protein
VWSEKGTVRGVLAPVLDRYAVGFNPVHGFTSATVVHDVAEDDDGRPLIILYVGDFDPSGMHMSEEDLPARFAQYGGKHVSLRRIALKVGQLDGLQSFSANAENFVDFVRGERFVFALLPLLKAAAVVAGTFVAFQDRDRAVADLHKIFRHLPARCVRCVGIIIDIGVKII